MSVVFTAGYEGTDINRFIATLKAVGVKQLADVRAVPISRKKGFSKRSLGDGLETEGIKYFHFLQLGDPKAGREAARAGHYKKFRDIYERHLDSDDSRASLQELLSIVRDAPTCLLCFERDPAVCHRSIVAKQLRISGFEVLDLFCDDPERYVRNASRMPRHHPRQSIAAA